jgi:hypothetical protein
MRSEAFQEKLVRTLFLVFVLMALALIVFSSPAQAGDRDVSVALRVGGHDGGVYLEYAHRGGARHDRHVGRRHGQPRGLGHHKWHKRHHRRHHNHRHARFIVPRHIVRTRVAYYDPWYAGRVWVPAHRHHHRVYDFPVYMSGVMSYRPHAYCGDELFIAGDLAWRGGYVSVRYGG